MESQWIEVEYVNFGRHVFVSGQVEDREFCIELNEDQKLKLYDFNEKQQRELTKFLTGLVEV